MLGLTQDLCMIHTVYSTIFTSKEATRKFNYDLNLIHAHPGIFESDYSYTDAQLLLQFSLMVTDANFQSKPFMSPPNYKVHSLIYDTCPLPMISKGIPNSKLNQPTPLGYLLYNTSTHSIVIVFTGTSNGCLASLDLNYLQSDLTDISNYQSGMRAHRGFYSAYLSIRPQLLSLLRDYIPQASQIIITGHSLGGAISSICALDLSIYEPIHYSFAAPLTFNDLAGKRFDELIPASYRIVNLSDMVTLFPLPIMPSGDVYCHTGILIPFQRNMGEYHRNHSLAYMIELNLKFTEIPNN